MTDTPRSLAAALSGRYRLERELGRGGTATVYLAYDLRHSRPVAVKVIHPELTRALGVERFLREIEIAASLNHPHILPLLDSGVQLVSGGAAAEQLWYAMPYVEGESLRARLRRETQLSIPVALGIARNVAAALAYAHDRGIIHRDIKPENILLAGGEALVADFGIARAVTTAAADGLTPTGLAVGTPAYMSPEQAAGDRALDTRSDVYSLGCVLYEMLAGEPPFTGPTAQAIQARRLSAPVPSLALVRDSIPPPVQAAVERALARVPADRFPTAAAFTEALTESAPAAVPGRGPTHRLSRWALGAAAVGLAAVGWMVARAGPAAGPQRLDAGLLAVAPFGTLSPSLEPWREGIVDMLSRSLDGAGALRTVSPTVSLKGWTGRSDRASAVALGRRTGAGLVLYGDLERRGADSLTVRAALLDLGRGGVPADIEVWGDTARADALVDSLAVMVLRELARTRPVGAVRRSPLGARSVPALKAFLRGEQAYRRNLWDSALVHYDRAVALDSAFTLAYRRLRQVLEWNPRTAETFRPADIEALRRGALQPRHPLAPRDSLLVTLDSLAEAVLGQTPGAEIPPDHFANRRRLLTILAEASRRYAGDPEVWYVMGEIGAHAQDPTIAGADETLRAFDKAIALDSGFAPAYIHTPGLALAVERGEPSRARRLLDAYLRLNPTDDYTLQLWLVGALLDPARAALSGTDSAVAGAPAGVLFTAAMSLIAWPDSAETAVRLFRRLAFGSPSFAGAAPTLFLRDTMVRRRLLAFELTRRGRLREAYRTHPDIAASPAEQWFHPYDRLAMMGGVPPDAAAAAYGRALERAEGEHLIALLPALPWWQRSGDTTSLRRFGSSLAEYLQRGEANPVLRAIWASGADAAHAYLALARGDSAAALRRLAAFPDSVCGRWLIECRTPRLTQARLLAATGQNASAAELLDRWGDLEPLPMLERARLAEQLQDRETAIRAYRYVAAVWRHADPELRPYVEEARRGLARLSREP